MAVIADSPGFIRDVSYKQRRIWGPHVSGHTVTLSTEENAFLFFYFFFFLFRFWGCGENGCENMRGACAETRRLLVLPRWMILGGKAHSAPYGADDACRTPSGGLNIAPDKSDVS